MSVVALRPVLGWSGRIKACLGCGARHLPELVGGLCVDCFEGRYGRLGLYGPVGDAEVGPVNSLMIAPAVVELPAPDGLPAPFMGERAPARVSAIAEPGEAPTKRWSPNYDACVDCGKTDSQHHARGLCKRCGMREYNARKKGGAIQRGDRVRASGKTGAAVGIPQAVAPASLAPPSVAMALDLSAVPLAALLAEVARRASALEADAAKFRQIRAVIG